MIKRITPGPGQESVWDYPRPPRLEASGKRIRVVLNGVTIADTHRAQRVLETSHPPVYYIPPEDIEMHYMTQTARRTFCEWKGLAAYYTVQVGEKRVDDVAWFYPEPTAPFAQIRNWHFTHPRWMRATWTMNGCKRKRAISTADGSRVRLSVPSKGRPTRGVGNPFCCAGVV